MALLPAVLPLAGDRHGPAALAMTVWVGRPRDGGAGQHDGAAIGMYPMRLLRCQADRARAGAVCAETGKDPMHLSGAPRFSHRDGKTPYTCQPGAHAETAGAREGRPFAFPLSLMPFTECMDEPLAPVTPRPGTVAHAALRRVSPAAVESRTAGDETITRPRGHAPHPGQPYSAAPQWATFRSYELTSTSQTDTLTTSFRHTPRVSCHRPQCGGEVRWETDFAASPWRRGCCRR